MRYLTPRSGESAPTVSAEDLVTVERILQLIDLKNGVLSCISNWFAAWRLTQEICFDFETLDQKSQCELAVRFKEVLSKMTDTGKSLTEFAVIDVLAINDDHFRLATGHTLADLGACIAFLEDRLVQWFEIGQNNVCDALWEKEGHGSDDLVP